MSSVSLVIRAFAPEDAEACRALVLEAMDDFEGVSPEAYPKLRRRILMSPYRQDLARMFCLVAEDHGRLAGIGALDENTIKRMYIARGYRGQGIGRTLYSHLEMEARRRGLRRLELESSLNAVGFYERLGFRRIVEKTWLLDGAPITNTLMEKDLT